MFWPAGRTAASHRLAIATPLHDGQPCFHSRDPNPKTTMEPPNEVTLPNPVLLALARPTRSMPCPQSQEFHDRPSSNGPRKHAPLTLSLTPTNKSRPRRLLRIPQVRPPGRGVPAVALPLGINCTKTPPQPSTVRCPAQDVTNPSCQPVVQARSHSKTMSLIVT